jgi:hypothetical protein
VALKTHRASRSIIATTAAGLLTTAAGVAILRAVDAQFVGTVPRGMIILLVAAAFVAVGPWARQQVR